MKLIQILKKFLDTNLMWKQFFSKNKDEFKNIRERLIEISHKLGMSVTDYKKLVSRVQKGEKESRIAKKEMVEANLRLVISIAKKYTNRGSSIFRSYSRRKHWPYEGCR